MNVRFVSQPVSRWEADGPFKLGEFQEVLFTKGFFIQVGLAYGGCPRETSGSQGSSSGPVATSGSYEIRGKSRSKTRERVTM